MYVDQNFFSKILFSTFSLTQGSGNLFLWQNYHSLKSDLVQMTKHVKTMATQSTFPHHSLQHYFEPCIQFLLAQCLLSISSSGKCLVLCSSEHSLEMLFFFLSSLHVILYCSFHPQTGNLRVVGILCFRWCMLMRTIRVNQSSKVASCATTWTLKVQRSA